MNSINGKILKSIGGFYHVETPDGVLICKARGLFRLKGVSPVAGDIAKVHFNGGEDAEPIITEIQERSNIIIRPPLANIDLAVIVSSTTEPPPNAFVLDKLIIIFENMGIEPCLVFTKTDKKMKQSFFDIYENAGFRVFTVDNTTGEGTDKLRKFLTGKTSALIGNSGVGKSSLLNRLLPELQLDTAEISKKLGRGKHTTRQVELFKYKNELGTGYIADTPGFSTVEAWRYGDLPSGKVAGCFREFRPFIGKCRYAGCRHIKEDGCEIITALNENKLSKSRYDSYTRIFEEARIKENTY